MATIGSLQVNIVANTENFTKGIQSVQKMAKSLRQNIQFVGAAAGGALVGIFSMFESVGSQLHDLSEVTGINVEKLDFLKYAAEQSGAGLETLTKAARELQTKGIDPNRFEEIAG